MNKNHKVFKGFFVVLSCSLLVYIACNFFNIQSSIAETFSQYGFEQKLIGNNSNEQNNNNELSMSSPMNFYVDTNEVFSLSSQDNSSTSNTNEANKTTKLNTPRLKASEFPGSNNVYCESNGTYNSSDTVQIQNTYTTAEAKKLTITQIALTNNEGKPSGSDYGTWTIKDATTTTVYFSGYIGSSAQTLTTPIVLEPQQSKNLVLSYTIVDHYKVSELLAKSDNDPFGYITWTYTEEAQTQAYAYKESDSNSNILKLVYDDKKSERTANDVSVYEINSNQSSDNDNWGWSLDRAQFSSVEIDPSFANIPESSLLTSTSYMFCSMPNCTQITGLKYLNTSKVSNMSHMFSDNSSASIDCSGFNTQSAVNMNSMFLNCNKATTINISSFNTANVTNMAYFFSGDSLLTAISLTNISTAAVVDMSYMFSNCSCVSSLDCSSFNTSNVENMSYMFNGCLNLNNVNISSFNTKNVSTFAGMFASCTSLSRCDLYSFTLDKVTNTSNMFNGCSKLTTICSNIDWTKSLISNSAQMFNGCVLLPKYNASITDITYAYPNNGSSGYLTNKSAYSYIDSSTLHLNYDENINSHSGVLLPISATSESSWGWNSSRSLITNVVIDPTIAYYNGITSANSMFYNMSSLSLINGLEYLNTENIKDMSKMFSVCKSLESVNLSKFNTTNVSNMQYMFYQCNNLANLDCSSFNTTNIVNMTSMFEECYTLTELNLSNFDTSSLKTNSSMFKNCKNLISINLLNSKFSILTDCHDMFSNCLNLKNIYCNANLSLSKNLTNSTLMFSNCKCLPNYDTKNIDATYAYPNNGTSGYFTAGSESALKSGSNVAFGENNIDSTTQDDSAKIVHMDILDFLISPLFNIFCNF